MFSAFHPTQYIYNFINLFVAVLGLCCCDKNINPVHFTLFFLKCNGTITGVWEGGVSIWNSDVGRTEPV